MKILTLNKKQQEKLLSLCEEFFPDYECALGFDVDQEICLEKGKKETWIHWYQLVLTELPKRIWKNFDINNNISKFPFWILDSLDSPKALLHQLIESEKHPVDFLWNFVKECKKNKYFKS